MRIVLQFSSDAVEMQVVNSNITIRNFTCKDLCDWKNYRSEDIFLLNLQTLINNSKISIGLRENINENWNRKCCLLIEQSSSAMYRQQPLKADRSWQR